MFTRKNSHPSELSVPFTRRPRWFVVGSGLLLVGVYLFTINQTAVQGYAIRSAEREIAQAKEENQRLKIEEAELRSLERIESARDRLHLVAVAPGSDTVSYIEAPGPLALR